MDLQNPPNLDSATQDRMGQQQQSNGYHNDHTSSQPEALDNLLKMVEKLRLELDDKTSECEVLRIRLDETNISVDSLSQKLDECKLTMFENNEDSRKCKEEASKSKKLEEDYVKLMNDFLDLGERSNQYKQSLVDQYLAKANAINNYEFLANSGALKHDLEVCKYSLDTKTADLCVATARIRNLEEENATKDKSLTELRKALEDAKITHRHEVDVLQDYINSLKNTIVSYEKTLAGL